MTVPRRVIQTARLRDQVYRILREDLQNGAFSAGKRLVELELAAEYGVSRTPVREALFQLAREGLIEDHPDRGFLLPVDTHDDFLDRLAVRLTLDPNVAAHAALRATKEQRESLQQLYIQMRQAHEESRFTDFTSSAHNFRVVLTEACHNGTLMRVSRVLEDQFLVVRNKQYREKENREIALKFDGSLVESIIALDAAAASRAARDYIEELIKRFGGAVVEQCNATPWVAIHENR